MLVVWLFIPVPFIVQETGTETVTLSWAVLVSVAKAEAKLRVETTEIIVSPPRAVVVILFFILSVTFLLNCTYSKYSISSIDFKSFL